MIEALRLYFKEESKIKDQEQFKKIFKECDTIQTLDKRISELEQEKAAFDRQLFFIKWLKFFKGIKIKNDLKTAITERESLPNKRDELLSSLKAFADGRIIGDGRSDFTRNITTYHFSHNGEAFDLLDVPGIEGSEKLVIDEIINATRKAHAIFYIKKEPTPPQKGDSKDSGDDSDKKGTIEKIKAQLHSQTEVYSIYNKPINSPRVLESSLTDSDEEAGLKSLDEKMSEILGEHYKTHKVISAQVAFYALAQCLESDSDLATKQAKFLEKYNKDSLMKQSGFLDFVNFLSQEMLTNLQTKIHNAHHNKALKVVEELKNSIQKITDEIFKPNLKEIERIKQGKEQIIENLGKELPKKCEYSAHNCVDEFEISTREVMYKYIESDVKNDEFKERLKNVIEARIDKLPPKLSQCFEKEQERFNEDIENELKNYADLLKDSIKRSSRIELKNDFGDRVEVKLNSGVNFWGLFGSLGGMGAGIAVIAATNWWNPVGWTAMALTVIGGLIGAAKALMGRLSSSYKKSQQKKETDKILKDVADNIKEDISEKINNESAIKKQIDEIKKSLNMPIIQAQENIATLENIQAGLEKLANSIKGAMK